MLPALFYDPLFLEHQTGRHPETAGRLTATLDLLQRRGLWDRLPRPSCAPASPEALLAVHTEDYLDLLRTQSERFGGGFLTADTPFSRRSWEAAVLGCGAAVGAVDVVLAGAAPAAFALVRPPGHHACPDHGMGFCLLNHAAVAARHAVRAHGLQRVLLLDWDVHHGNGTQETFYEDPTVLYFSMHQYPAYPGTGGLRETGAGAGEGTTVNVPLPPGVGDSGYGRVLREVLLPLARRFQPELILVSAGYDAHWSNTTYLNSIRMAATVRGFAEWTGLARDLAAELCPGRLALTLEGGYDHAALAWSVDATLHTLLGEPAEDPLGPPPAGAEPDLDDLLAQVRALHGLSGGS
jgi:acetoin utilization deacetylase AcuC-like enzyme